MSYRSPYASVQQRTQQRKAAQFEALSVGLMPIMIMFAMLGSALLFASTKYAVWERETFSPLSTDYEPSPIAKPGLFVSEHSDTIAFLVIAAAVLVLYAGVTKVIDRFTK